MSERHGTEDEKDEDADIETSAAKPPATSAPAANAAPESPAEKAAPSVLLAPPEAPPWYSSLREEPPAILGKLLGLVCIGLILLVWYLVTAGGVTDRIISPAKLPSPAEVIGSFSALKTSLIDGIIATLVRVGKGFLWAAVIGVGLGVIAGSFRGVNAFFTPVVLFGRSVPIAALISLTLLIFGIGETQKEMFIFIASVPFVFSDTVKAVSLVPQRYVETAETLGASRLQIIYKVIFPLALPDIITGLRFMFGLALGYIVLAEAINAQKGLGMMITVSEHRGAMDQIYFLLIVIALLAYVIDWLIRFFQRYAFPYRNDL